MAAIGSIAATFGGMAETLRNWLRQIERDQGLRTGLTSDERGGDTTALARRRRGIEPLRVVIMPQIFTSSADGWDGQPIPIVF